MEKTKDEAGIDKAFFDSYYKGQKETVAYKLINIKWYKNLRTLNVFGVNDAPQSYQYVSNT